MSDVNPVRTRDPVVERYKRDLDRTLLRESLRLTPEQRFARLEELARFAIELRAAGRRLRRGRP